MNRFQSLSGWLLISAIVVVPAMAFPAQPSANAQHQLVGEHGMTLYVFDTDGDSGHSTCSGPCASVWPPYAADAGATASDGFSAIARPDSSLQWAFKGRPLYRYAGDAKPGDHRGDGINGTWHIALSK